MRKVEFINGEYYHIYNRGVDQRVIFLDKEDYTKFLRCLIDFNNQSYYDERVKILKNYGFKELSYFLEKVEKVVEVVCYCLNPTHFHLILKQLIDNGIPKFLHKVGTAFTNFFNKKYKRTGSLFEGPYKAVRIENNDHLLWLSAYINGNCEIHGITQAENYKWSSYRTFLGKKEDKIITNREIILSQFGKLKPFQDYRKFVKIVIEESRKKKEMEKYLLEQI